MLDLSNSGSRLKSHGTHIEGKLSLSKTLEFNLMAINFSFGGQLKVYLIGNLRVSFD